MTSIYSSSQKFDKADWIQQKIEKIRERCGTANSGETEDEQRAEVRRRMVGALAAIAMRSSEDLTLDTASRMLYGLAVSPRTGQPAHGELTEDDIRTIREVSGMAQQSVEENNTDTIGIAA